MIIGTSKSINKAISYYVLVIISPSLVETSSYSAVPVISTMTPPKEISKIDRSRQLRPTLIRKYENIAVITGVKFCINATITRGKAFIAV